MMMMMSSNRQVPTTSAAADVTSTTVTSPRPAVVELVQTAVVTLPSPAVTPGGRRPPAAASSPSRPGLQGRAAEGRAAAERKDAGSVMSAALDDALAMLTSVVTDACQPRPPSTEVAAPGDVVAPAADQSTCGSPHGTGQSRASISLLVEVLPVQRCISAVLVIALCQSVCWCVCHKPAALGALSSIKGFISNPIIEIFKDDLRMIISGKSYH